VWRAILWPILGRIAPKIFDALLSGKPVELITLGELLTALDKNRLVRLAAEERAKRRLGVSGG